MSPARAPAKKPSRTSESTRTGTHCSQCPLRQIKSLREFTKEELQFVSSFKIGELSVEAGATIAAETHDSTHLYTVLDGWAMRSKLMESGKRQVLNYAILGDFVGLQSVLFDKMEHTVTALTDVRLCVFQRERLWEIYREHPGLAFDLTWLASREESILADHLATVGQMPAFGRLAYILLHIFERARRVGLTRANRLAFPVTQEDIADTMGLSIVHTNKTLQRLKARGWIEWRRNELVMHDEDAMAAAGGIERREPRQRPFI